MRTVAYSLPLFDTDQLEHQAAAHLLIKFWKEEDEENGVDEFRGF
jgi:hypothetical protein